MRASVLAENLKKGVSVVMRGVSSKAQLPVLSMIKIKTDKSGVWLSSTDLEISFRVMVRAKTEEDGEIVVPAKLLNDLVGTLPAGNVELVEEKQTLSITGPRIKAQIVGQGAAEFPALPTASGKGLTIDVEEYSRKMERVAVSSARDETRPVLSGVLWSYGVGSEKVTLVATDGYRLGVDYLMKVEGIDTAKEEKFILPVRAVLELARVVEPGMKTIKVEFDADKQQVVFVAGEVEMSSRLIAGQFPPYQKVVPTDKKLTAKVNRDELLEAVRRTALFARDSANVIKIEITDDELVVTANNDQMGNTETELSAEIDGEKVTSAFNAKYLLDYLGVVGTETVIWETEGMLKPAVFRLPEEDFLHVIMPVRVQG